MTDGSRSTEAGRTALAPVIPLRVPEEPARLRLVPPQVRRRRTAVVTIIAMTVMFAVMLGLATFQTFIAQGQSTLDHLRVQTSDAQVAYAKLRLQVAQLESPSRIVSAAKQRLGLVTPATIRYIAPSGDNALAVKQAADSAAADAPSSSPTTTIGVAWSKLKSLVGTTP